MLVFSVVPGVAQATNATPNTENDSLFIKPGATRCVSLMQMLIRGAGANLTALTSIACRVKKWTTTAASAGTPITPAPRDPGFQAAKATAGYAAGGVTSGTGGPALLEAFGCSATAGGGFVAPSADAYHTLEGAATQSIDAFVSSGLASMPYELDAAIVE